MKYFISIIIIKFSIAVFGQQRINQVFDVPWKASNVKNMIKKGDEYFLFYNEGIDNKVKVFRISEQSRTFNIISGVKLGWLEGVTLLDDRFYFMGSDADNNNNKFVVGSFNEEVTDISFKNGFTTEDNGIVLSIISWEDKIYVVTQNDWQIMQDVGSSAEMFVIDKEGQLLSSGFIEDGPRDAFLNYSTISLDNNLLLYGYTESSNASVFKYSSQGELIWKYCDFLSSSLYHKGLVELDDGRFVLMNVGWINGQYHKHIFSWLDPEGNKIMEKSILVSEEEDYRQIGLVKSKNGGFFAHGSYRDLFSRAHITKFSDEGDTIWTHKYHLGEFSLNIEIDYNVFDIIEELNGDLSILITITDKEGFNKAWFIQTDSLGCIDGIECQEDLVNSENIKHPKDLSLRIYPNPANETIVVSQLGGQYSFDFEIFDVNGKLYKKGYTEDGILSIEELPKGLFIIKLKGTKGHPFSVLFQKV